MKKRIRLTETGLHKIVKESVKNILNEKKYPNPMGGHESRINAYPEYAADFDDNNSEDYLPVSPIPNRERLHTLDRTTDAFGDWKKGDHAYYEDGEVYPSAEWSDTNVYGEPNHYHDWSLDADKELEKLQKQRFKNDLDKQWQDTKEMEKIFKQADSRPLHRKGSLNRAMDESLNRKINRIVKESVNKILKEHTWGDTPEQEDDELPEEQIVKQGKNYVLKKGWYLGDGKNDTRGLTDYRCDIFLTPQQIEAFNNYVDKKQASYINSNGHQYSQEHVFYDSYEDTNLGLTKIHYGDMLDPHDDKNGIIIILKNFTDTSFFNMPDAHNIRYYISKP